MTNSANKALIHISAINTVPKSKLDTEQDDAIPGVYEVALDPDIPSAQRANAALDVFHESFGVDCRDDFEFVAFDPATGRVIEQDEGTERGIFDGRGDVEKISNEPLSVFRVALSAHSPGESPADLGEAAIVAQNVAAAKLRTFELLWDARLETTGCSPGYEVADCTRPAVERGGRRERRGA